MVKSPSPSVPGSGPASTNPDPASFAGLPPMPVPPVPWLPAAPPRPAPPLPPPTPPCAPPAPAPVPPAPPVPETAPPTPAAAPPVPISASAGAFAPGVLLHPTINRAAIQKRERRARRLDDGNLMGIDLSQKRRRARLSAQGSWGATRSRQ